ncbi:unnamed protein product [marine sediment metagenome]|uniref:Uncharacterized protein n=1 Tax=marine sediment metagenome TaxID=412755 RepID=X1BBW4_9ZZZZ
MTTMMNKKKFDSVIDNALKKYCDKKISDTTENVDPDGYNKVRIVIWFFRPYTFTAKYIFGGLKEYPTFAPLGITARMDGETEEQPLKDGDALAEKIAKAQVMREAGMV